MLHRQQGLTTECQAKLKGPILVKKASDEELGFHLQDLPLEPRMCQPAAWNLEMRDFQSTETMPVELLLQEAKAMKLQTSMPLKLHSSLLCSFVKVLSMF